MGNSPNTASLVKPLAIFIPLELLAGALIILRFVTRLRIKKVALGLEDYCILAAFLITLAESFIVVSLFHLGFGVHVWDLTESLDKHAKLLQIFWVTCIIFFVAMMLVKIAVLLLYRRVFILHKTFRIICDITLVFIILYSVAASVSTVFTCKPIEFYWTKVYPGTEGHCSKPLEAWDPYFAFNLATDFILVVLPMPMLQALQIHKRKKYVLTSVFILGLVPCVAGILRLKPIEYAASPDLTYWMSDIVVLAGVELTTAIICATAPALTPLLSVYFPKLMEEQHTEPVVVPEVMGSDGVLSPTFSMAWSRRKQRSDSLSAPLSPSFLPWISRPATSDTFGRISEESRRTNRLAVPDVETGLKHNSWSIMHEILDGSKGDLPTMVKEMEDMSTSTSQIGRSGATSQESIHFVDDDESDVGANDIVAPIQESRRTGQLHFQPTVPASEGSIRAASPYSVTPSISSINQAVGQSRLLMSRNLKHSAKPSVIDSVIQSANHSLTPSMDRNGDYVGVPLHSPTGLANLGHSPGPSISQSINPSVTFSITRNRNAGHSASPSTDTTTNHRPGLRGLRGASRSRNYSDTRSRRPSTSLTNSRRPSVGNSNLANLSAGPSVNHSASNSGDLAEMSFLREPSEISHPSVILQSSRSVTAESVTGTEGEVPTSWLRLSRSTYRSNNTYG